MKLLGFTLALAAAGALAAILATARAGTATAKAQVDQRTSSLGRILVDDRGRTLYLFAADKHGKSVCYGKCATFWPPLFATKAAKTGPGLKPSLFGTTRRRDGRLQVTYARHPLYRFAADKAPGQLKGQGVDAAGGLWWVLAASGKAIERKQAPAVTTTAETTTTSATTTTSYPRGSYP